jgi:hypothetical protein
MKLCMACFCGPVLEEAEWASAWQGVVGLYVHDDVDWAITLRAAVGLFMTQGEHVHDRAGWACGHDNVEWACS